MCKKTKWSDEYVQYGFTYKKESDGIQRHQCMICNAKLRNSSVAPAKLKEHFLKQHGDGKYKDTTLAEFKVKRARFEDRTLPSLGFIPIDKLILTASYEVAYLIATQCKPHTIGESLIIPAVLKMATIMVGKGAEDKFSFIPLSNDSISSRKDEMSKDSSSCRFDFKPSKIQSPTRRDYQRFKSKPACYFRGLCERRRGKARVFIL